MQSFYEMYKLRRVWGHACTLRHIGLAEHACAASVPRVRAGVLLTHNVILTCTRHCLYTLFVVQSNALVVRGFSMRATCLLLVLMARRR